MPPKTASQLKEKAERLRKTLREKGASMSEERARHLRKKVRRAQRRRRVLVAATAKADKGKTTPGA
jgi:Mrp family chromosome partitioning ATPase